MCKKLLPLIFSVFFVQISFAATGNWSSKATGSTISFKTNDSPTPLTDATGKYLTVVYLENLGFNKVGGNSNATDVAWLLSKGYRVIELDYAKNSNAISPNINADIIDINDAIFAGSFCGLTNCSQYQSYVLFEGYRIARNVSYYLDDPTIYNYPTTYTVGDSLHMDIVYPANSSLKVPVILSFSYSNSMSTSKDQRLNLGNTLAGFNDSFLEGAPAKGIAWAIADHPKYCNWGNGKPTGGANDTYKSYQTNPDAARKVKSAVRTLRSLGENMGLSGKIGIYGFSRGTDAGSMAVGDKSVPEFENYGLYQGTSDEVHAAALGSGVYDFTQIYNFTGDGDSNLETRCPWVWGALSSSTRALWESMGSAYLVETTATAPVMFFFNTDDAGYYQDQRKHFKAKLNTLGVYNDSIVNYGTGHSVPQTSEPLTKMYNFFERFLLPPSVNTGIQSLEVEKDNQLTVSFDKSKDILCLNFNKIQGEPDILIYDQQGKLIKSIRRITISDNKKTTINLSDINLPSGIYIVKAHTNKVLSARFIK